MGTVVTPSSLWVPDMECSCAPLLRSWFLPSSTSPTHLLVFNSERTDKAIWPPVEGKQVRLGGASDTWKPDRQLPQHL